MWINLDDKELALVKKHLRAARRDDGEMTDAERLYDRIEERQKGGPNDDAFIQAALDIHEEAGTLEIDSDPVVSDSDEGAYVMAWVWVSNEDAGIEEPEEDEEAA